MGTRMQPDKAAAVDISGPVLAGKQTPRQSAHSCALLHANPIYFGDLQVGRFPPDSSIQNEGPFGYGDDRAMSFDGAAGLGTGFAPPLRTSSRNILTRWLHFGVACSIVLSLALGAAATTRVTTGEITAATIAFTLHKFIGLNALLLVSLYIAWSAVGAAKRPTALFPWLSLVRVRRILAELGSPGRWQRMEAFPSAVQGLGLLVALASTLSGLALVLEVIEPGLLGGKEGVVAHLHLAGAAGLCGYLFLHVGATTLHYLAGERRFLAIFALFRRN